MRIIESKQNELIKKYSKLKQKKYREEYKQFIIEGKINIYDSLKLISKSSIESIIATNLEGEEFLKAYPHLEDKLILVSEEVISKLSSYDSVAGIIMIAQQQEKRERISSEYIVYLDRIRDPGNLGTIIRTAAAAGYGVILDNCCELYNEKVIRSSMSAIISVPICLGNEKTLDEYKREGYAIIGGDLDGCDIFGIKEKEIIHPIIIVIGNEAEGISQSIKNKIEKKVTIPMQGIESLNAALAAGILMFEFRYRIANNNKAD